MKKYKELNDVVRRYNGLVARYAKDKSAENKKLFEEALSDLHKKVSEVLDDQN